MKLPSSVSRKLCAKPRSYTLVKRALILNNLDRGETVASAQRLQRDCPLRSGLREQKSSEDCNGTDKVCGCFENNLQDSGGELFDAIIENEFYSEMDAARLVRQIVTTLEYLHSKNIVHRDIKVRNLPNDF
jgi:hypothetical protein